jgi:predicted  nucleic acid-binding Zn-ribbon protein
VGADVGGMLAGLGCEKREERILPKVDSANQIEAGEQSRIEREEFIRQAQKEIDDLGVKLDDIRKKAVEATGAVKNKLDQKIVALEQEQKSVEEKLANLKAETGEKWKELKAGVTAATEKLRQSVQDAM